MSSCGGKLDLPEKLLICGSGASEAVPALFCTCKLCAQARANGGKDVRSRTAYQLGSQIQIDFGPDIFYQREKLGLHYENMRHLFITHPHKDHFSPLQLTYHTHAEPGPAVLSGNTLTLHGTRQVMAMFHRDLDKDFSKMQLQLDELKPVVDHRELENGMRFTSIPAFHFCPGAVNYIVELPGGFTFFIGTDSGPFQEETWEILKEFHFDLMILDGTAGMLDIRNGGHMTAKEVVAAVEKLRRKGCIDSETQLVTNHFAHCAGMLHEELEKFYRPYGIEPGYDGMLLDLRKKR